MAKKEKLLEKFLSKPLKRNLTFRELVTLFQSLGYELINKEGSRVAFWNKATSNHVHLLVVDDGDRDVIPRAMQLVAGRTGQEYDQRLIINWLAWPDPLPMLSSVWFLPVFSVLLEVGIFFLTGSLRLRTISKIRPNH
jgi:hypothetical protein